MFEPLFKTRSLLHAFVAGGLCIVVVVGYVITAAFYLPELYAEAEERALTQGIAAELAHLSTQGDAVAGLDTLQQALAEEDSYAILGVLLPERLQRGIGLMGAATPDGSIISRTKTPGVRGDNVFLTAPVAVRLLTSSSTVSSVEATSFDPRQMMLTTGRWVYRDGAQIGILFANTLTDDEFSRTFKARYLDPGVQVAFFTSEHGLYGTSFEDDTGRTVAESLTQPGVPVPEGTMRVGLSDGRRYMVHRVYLHGLEGVPGGAVLFIPATSTQYIWVALLVPAGLFGVVVWLLRRRYKERPTMRETVAAWLAGVGFVGAMLAASYFLQAYFPVAAPGRYPLYNSTLRFSPESGVYSSAYGQSISLMLHSGGESINTVGVSLVFDPTRVRIESIDTDNSLCNSFIERVVDQEAGRLSLECIVPNPGFSGDGVVAVLHIKPLRAGEATLHFEDTTRVLANDGLGTNVLRTASDASFRFSAIEHAEDGSLPLVYSPTHPNPTRWYARSAVTLRWVPPRPLEFSVRGVLDPAYRASIGPATSVRFTAPRDGVYVFEPRTASTTEGVYTVRIDTTPPETVRLEASDTTVAPGSTVRLRITGSDALSGLQHTFYLKVDDDLFYPVGEDAYVPLVERGAHTIVARVFDKAGNYKDAVVVVRVADK